MEPVWSAFEQSLQPATLSAAELTVRLGVAALCGPLLGIDREVRSRTMGWRTYILASLGAASFSVLMVELVHAFRADNLRLDPTRIVKEVIGGIGFLGAGLIIQERGHVRGATTGAGIWMVGAIGMAAGFGFHVHALVMTGFSRCWSSRSWASSSRGCQRAITRSGPLLPAAGSGGEEVEER